MNGVNGGYAAFDNFKLEEPMADRSMNLPLGKHIMLINKGDKKQLWANPHGVLSPSGSRQIKMMPVLFLKCMIEEMDEWHLKQ